MWRQRLVLLRRPSCRHYTSSLVLWAPEGQSSKLPDSDKPRKRGRPKKLPSSDEPSTGGIRRPQDSLNNYIDIRNATFYRSYPSTSDPPGTNPPLVSDLNFLLPGQHIEELKGKQPPAWVVISESAVSRTTLLQILAGQYLCLPSDARTYPRLSEMHLSPASAIKYVGFDAERGNTVGGASTRGAYMSARYESRREETDFTVRDYLTGNTELNALEHSVDPVETELLDDLVRELGLDALLEMPVANLSNGQTRQARIAKALMSRPKVLLLDAPFMGLDPMARGRISRALERLAAKDDLRLVLSLRPSERVPQWVDKRLVLDQSAESKEIGKPKLTPDGWPPAFAKATVGEAIVQMQGVKVSYGDKTVLGDWTQSVEGEQREGLWWSLHRGQRYGIFGPNGSGKTTMLSLITSDHPQTYGLPIKLFGRSRLPGPGEPGISVFDLQKRMGHSSPEVHAFFPKQLTVRRVLESAWADAPLARPQLTAAIDRRVTSFIRWFARELNPDYPGRTFHEQFEIDQKPIPPNGRFNERRIEDERKKYSHLAGDDSDIVWADNVRFRDLSFANQRLALFLRALVAQPDLVILDEALSGLDQATRDKALTFLSHGEKQVLRPITGLKPSIVSHLDEPIFEGLTSDQALLVTSHARDDVPGCVRDWIYLPEPGTKQPPRTGVLQGRLFFFPPGWHQIWGQLK